MELASIVCLCFLSIVIIFTTTEIIPSKSFRTAGVLLAMFLGLIVTIVFMYLIIQLGKKWDIYEETKSCILIFGALLLVVEAVYHCLK